MRIALVIYGALDRRSGGYSYDTDLVAFLGSHGHEVEVHSQPEPPRRQGRIFDDWYRANHAGLDLIIFDELVFPALTRDLENWRSTASNHPVWIGLVHHLRASEGDPLIYGAASRARWHSLERRFLRLMNGFIFNSQDTREAVQAMTGDARPPWVLARPPLRRLAGPPEARVGQSGFLRIIFVGNLIPRKNLHGLLAALDRIVRERPDLDWRLEVIGNPTFDPTYSATCQAQTLLGGIGGRVVFCGRLDDAALAGAYARADLLAVPSFHEGWGMVYIEAMAHGVVPLGGQRGGGAEAIGNAGILVDPDDPPAMAAVLIDLMDHPARLALLRTRAAARLAWLAHQGTGFAQIPDFLADFQGWKAARQAGSPAGSKTGPAGRDFNRYLESKISVDDRSLHPRILDGLRDLPQRPAVLDLGGGTGSMARRLSSRGLLAADSRYLLVDSGVQQLDLAQKLCRPLFPQGSFDTENADAQLVLDRIRHQVARGEAPFNLVIAHALLDLFDPDCFAHALAGIRAERYLLTHIFDGLTGWYPVIDEALDREVIAAYHRSMDERHRAGGEGSSRAGQAWLEALPLAGLVVRDAAAGDWIVRPDARGSYPADEGHFLACMLGFFSDSLRGRADLDQAALDWWLWRRQAQLSRGQLGLVVHQLDILAVSTTA